MALPLPTLPSQSSLSSGPPSTEELPPVPEAEVSSLTLENKHNAHLHYTFYPPSPSSAQKPNPFARSLVVFLNGLMLPRSSWDPAIQLFLESRIQQRLPYPALLSYDRYGQGDSDRDPDDVGEPPCHGHDAMAAVHALRQFTLQMWKQRLSATNPTTFPALIFVCNSIGCALARLFAQTYPGTVLGLLFLDSIVANGDFVTTTWPDVDNPSFDPKKLPPDVTPDDVRRTRQACARIFHPSVPNAEGLSRRNLATLLPHAHAPRLEGYHGEGPFLTVVGHDWTTFAEQNAAGQLGIPARLTMAYANPEWQRYNEGLVRITDDGRGIGPLVAVGCGHFVQKDGPGFVADELVSLLDRVVNRVEQDSARDR